jgi:hypothetical protein
VEGATSSDTVDTPISMLDTKVVDLILRVDSFDALAKAEDTIIRKWDTH